MREGGQAAQYPPYHICSLGSSITQTSWPTYVARRDGVAVLMDWKEVEQEES